jgi:hypothetical protein
VLYLLYPEYETRFLFWKGALSIAFLVAVLATLIEGVPGPIRIRGLRWMR